MIIKLNNKFYSKEIIEEALRDFDELIEGKIINESFEIKIVEKKEIPFLKEEFCNYVLGLMKNKGFA
ncbi:MAG: HxsD-like protein [Nanobdellota archaeon]